MTDYAELYAAYRERGLAARVGRGSNPVVVVVDFMRGFTDPSFPMGMDLAPELASAQRLLRRARALAIPVVLVRSAYRPDGRDALHWQAKMPGARGLVDGSPWAEFDPALEMSPADIVVTKKFASSFFGTPLASILTTLGVDTVLLAGTTTSGCVRATALDSHQHGFRTTVVREAVGDRAEGPHWANLFDLDTKYADVEKLSTVLDYLDDRRGGTQPDGQGRKGVTAESRSQAT